MVKKLVNTYNHRGLHLSLEYKRPMKHIGCLRKKVSTYFRVGLLNSVGVTLFSIGN